MAAVPADSAEIGETSKEAGEAEEEGEGGGVGGGSAGEEKLAVAAKASLESPHLASCYEVFSTTMGGSLKVLLDTLKEEECETWMSGLICARTPVCAEEYMLLVPEGKVSTASISSSSSSSSSKGEECPPGCGCDNPWQFVQDAMMKPSMKSISSKEGQAATEEHVAPGTVNNINGANGNVSGGSDGVGKGGGEGDGQVVKSKVAAGSGSLGVAKSESGV